MRLPVPGKPATVTIESQGLRVGSQRFAGVTIHHQPVPAWREPSIEGLPPAVDRVVMDSSLLSNSELRDMQREFGANLNGEGPIPDYLDDEHAELQVTSLAEILEDITI
jgi:hypothetical protein